MHASRCLVGGILLLPWRTTTLVLWTVQCNAGVAATAVAKPSQLARALRSCWTLAPTNWHAWSSQLEAYHRAIRLSLPKGCHGEMQRERDLDACPYIVTHIAEHHPVCLLPFALSCRCPSHLSRHFRATPFPFLHSDSPFLKYPQVLTAHVSVWPRFNLLARMTR